MDKPIALETASMNELWAEISSRTKCAFMVINGMPSKDTSEEAFIHGSANEAIGMTLCHLAKMLMFECGRMSEKGG